MIREQRIAMSNITHRKKGRSMRHVFIVFIGILFVVVSASAETCTGTTCTYTASGTEPTTKVGGAPLNNLKQIVLTPKLNGVTQAPVVIPATAATGGGAFSKNLTITPTPCAITTLSVDM